MPFFSRLRLALAASTLALAAPGCSLGRADAADSLTPVEWRVMVKLAEPVGPIDEIVQRANRSSGVPVRHVAAVNSQWHGLALSCRSEPACRDALLRLKTDRAYFESVEPDGQRRSHGASRPLS